MPETRKVDELVWRKDLYPRFEPNPSTIQRYAQDIEQLPPVEINQHNELIDGYHRWTAHKKAEVKTIQVVVTQTDSDRHFAQLAMRRNARHGLHISNDEKKSWLLSWYTGLSANEKQELADDMGVSLRTVSRWTARKDKDLKAQRDKQIADLWLACWTEQEIADEVGVARPTITGMAQKLSENDIWHKSTIFSTYQDPQWTPPLYNVWKQQSKSNSTSHFGNSEASFLDRLLYLYTEPFDIVVDPFGGGGASIDVCKKRLRRYWVSDRLPIVERRDMRQHDILDGPPPLHKRWGDVKLLYLDPPYWKQAEGEYSKDSADLANMELDQFHKVLSGFITDCSSKMHNGSHIAMLMQPTQWRAPGRRTIDHAFTVRARLAEIDEGLTFVETIQCPYESQQANAQQVTWAKENKRLLELGRTITVWEVVK